MDLEPCLQTRLTELRLKAAGCFWSQPAHIGLAIGIISGSSGSLAEALYRQIQGICSLQIMSTPFLPHIRVTSLKANIRSIDPRNSA
jgi:hypothetical protein